MVQGEIASAFGAFFTFIPLYLAEMILVEGQWLHKLWLCVVYVECLGKRGESEEEREEYKSEPSCFNTLRSWRAK